MKKLRVAMATRFPYAENDAFSGLVQVSLRLCNALAERDDIELYVVSRAYLPKKVEHRQINQYQVTFLPYSAHWYRNPTFYIGAAVAIKNELLRIQPDIVHCQATAETAVGGLISGLPLVTTIHGIYSAEASNVHSLRARLAFPVLKVIESWYVKRLPHVISCSPYVTQFVRQNNVNSQIYNVSNPIDPAFFEVDINTTQPDPQSILMVGTIYYRKGQDLLIEAMRQLVQEFPDVKLTIVGNEIDAVFAVTLKQMIQQYNLSNNVSWLGAVNQTQLLAEMRTHKIVCLPSREETLPMSLSQAMAVGNICVASNAGGIPQMITHGEHGFLFPTNDSFALYQVLSNVLKMSNDQLKEMRRRNRLMAEQMHRDTNVAAQTIEVYRTILTA